MPAVTTRRAAWAGIGTSGASGAGMTSQRGPEVFGNRREGSLEQLRLGDHDEIEAGCRFVPPKNLSNQAFSSVPLHRAAEPPRGADAKAGGPGPVGKRDERQETALAPGTLLLDTQVVGPATDAFRRPEALGHRSDGRKATLLRGYAQALPALGPAPLEHLAPFLGLHADQEPMRAVPAPPVGLKRALHAMEPLSVRRRNPNSIRLPSLCQPGERCARVAGLF